MTNVHPGLEVTAMQQHFWPLLGVFVSLVAGLLGGYWFGRKDTMGGWFTRYKGFIDTLITGLLTVVLGTCGVYLSLEANRFAQRQAVAAEIQVAPLIECHQAVDVMDLEETLEVKVRGAEVSDLRCELFQLIEVSVSDRRQQRRFWIPVQYLYAVRPGLVPREYVAAFSGDQGDEYVLRKECQRQAQAMNYSGAWAEVAVHLRVRYTDALGKRHSRTGRVSRWDGGAITWLDEKAAGVVATRHAADPESQHLASARDTQFAIALYRWLMDAAPKHPDHPGLQPVERGAG